MSADTISNPVKIAIVGMTGSGKTVLVTTLAVKMAQMTLKDIYMGPSGENRRQTLKYTQGNWEMLKKGLWPPSTPAGELIELQWELNTENCQATVQFLDCAGQDIRSLFKTDNFNPASLGSDLRRVYNSVNSANVLILLVNMKDLLATSNITDEILDLDQMIHTLQQRSDIPRRVAVAFSQYDKYKPEVDQKYHGDFEEYVRHYLPYLYGQYKRFHSFELIPVASVNDTREVIENGEVKQYPALNFASYNLETLIYWIANSVEELAPEIAKAKKAEQERKRKEKEERLWLEAEEQSNKSTKETKVNKPKKEAKERNRLASFFYNILWNVFAFFLIGIGLYFYNQDVRLYVNAFMGYPEEQYKLGKYCADKMNSSGAVKWFRKAAEQGHVGAQSRLGYYYEKGVGADKDLPEAVKWYRKAAEQGNAKAQFDLGKCYSNGIGLTKDATEAVKWYRKAAEQGNADAQCNLGYCYNKGEGILEDKFEAVNWYRKAAEQGDAQAQNNLGCCYRDGEGVAQDYKEAVKWFFKGAENGNSTAQCNLGWCYINGMGIAEDKGQAAGWFSMAAKRGDAVAQFNLGRCYEQGEGVAKNESKAVTWYRKAADQGNEYAIEALKRLNAN